MGAVYMDKPRTDLLSLHLRKPYLCAQILALSIGMTTCGYSVLVISPAAFPLYRDVAASTMQKETITAVFPLGAMLGCIIGTLVSDKWGRRMALLVGNFLSITAGLLMSQATTSVHLITGRLGSGVGTGLLSAVSPVYMAEVVPPLYRGACLSTLGLLWIVGQLMSLVFAAVLGESWRWLLALSAFPGLIQSAALLTFLPESPRWLYQNHKETEAITVMQRFYHGNDLQKLERLQDEIQGIKTEIALQGDMELGERLTEISTTYRSRLLIVCGFMVCVPAGGLAAVSLYSAQIMDSAGFSFGQGPILSSILLFSLSFFATGIAIKFIDKVGRRSILLWTLPFQALSTFLMAVSLGFSLRWLSFLSLVGYLCFVSAGSCPMMGIMPPELFPVTVT